jgi:hypothetical protein
MRQKQKKLLVGGVIILLLGSLGWFGLYKYTLYRVEESLALVEINLKQKGFEVEYSALKIYGAPLSFSVVIQDLHLKSPKRGIEWKGAELKLSMRPWQWQKATYSLLGEQRVTLRLDSIPLKEFFLGDAHGNITWTSQQTLDQFSLLANQLNFFKGTHLQPISLEGVTLNLKEMADLLTTQIYLTATLKGVDALLQEAPSSQPIAFSFDAHLSGFQENRPFPASLEEWRDGGGVLDISLLRLAWLPLDIAGEGTLTFDGDMYPLGSFSTRIMGFQEGLNHLVKGGLVKQKNAAMVAFVLNMLSRSGKGGEKQINVPITFQDRHMSVGSIPLVKMGRASH